MYESERLIAAQNRVVTNRLIEVLLQSIKLITWILESEKCDQNGRTHKMINDNFVGMNLN